jgi:hypothetical protein
MELSRFKALLSWAILGFVFGVAVLALVDGLSLLNVVEETLFPSASHWYLSGIGGAVLAVAVVVTVERGVFYNRLEYC